MHIIITIVLLLISYTSQVLALSPEDIDKNGNINVEDYRLLRQNIGRTNQQGYIPPTINPDISPNGKVDIYDLSKLIKNIGKSEISNTPAQNNIKILCDGKNYSGWGNTAPIEIGNNAEDTNPNIQKVIRNCKFVNPVGVAVHKPAILIKTGKNILIENSTFDNIRTLTPDDGIFAIAMSGNETIDNVTVRNNYFKDIGADAIQPGTSGPKVTNIKIENNEIAGSEDVGENGIDIKGVQGPIFITGNKIHGFRPCESSKTKVKGNQDCTGSNGPGITIHTGNSGYSPSNIYIEDNEIYDNIYGINISGGNNIVIRNNIIRDNLKTGIQVTGGMVQLNNNTYSNNPKKCTGINPCQ